ncbi:MAG: sulfatase-like hydrolase/transferase, partial [Planctomycetota bacterium]
MPKRPNLLFLMTDHQRADSLGMVRHGVEVTPHLNRLASQATAFSRAYNTCPLCVPARTALATGKYPTRNGIVTNDWRGRRAGDHLTLHEELFQAGYDVAHIGVDHIRVRPGHRQRVDFAKWVSNGDHARFLESHGVPWPPPDAAAFKREITENQGGERVCVRYSNTRVATWPHPAAWFKDSFWAEQAVEFLGSGRDRPFALFVYLWAPHPPLWLPEPYASRFDPARLELPANVGRAADGEPSNRRLGIAAQLADGLSMEQWREVWAAHLGLVSLADAAIGRILEALDAAGHGEDTVVVFTVDHGDHLGQHAMYQKMEMYEPAIRVPLLIRAPGCEARVHDVPVSHLDVLPTLLDLMGLDPQPALDGLSLADCVRSDAPPPERPVFCQYSGNPAIGDIRRAVVTRRHKYVHDPAAEPELYDLDADPLEMTNLAPDPAYDDLLADLHEQCCRWHEEHGDWVSYE